MGRWPAAFYRYIPTFLPCRFKSLQFAYINHIQQSQCGGGVTSRLLWDVFYKSMSCTFLIGGFLSNTKKSTIQVF